MTNIAILTCLDATKVCTGAGCLEAFFKRVGAFKNYDDELTLKAFWHCNGCGQPSCYCDGLKEKIERLEKMQVTHIHIGICAFGEKHQCKTMEEIIDILKDRGFHVVFGTHE
nr:CGGC domain-containing protein [Sedimentibacter sp.]